MARARQLIHSLQATSMPYLQDASGSYWTTATPSGRIQSTSIDKQSICNNNYQAIELPMSLSTSSGPAAHHPVDHARDDITSHPAYNSFKVNFNPPAFSKVRSKRSFGEYDDSPLNVLKRARETAGATQSSIAARATTSTKKRGRQSLKRTNTSARASSSGVRRSGRLSTKHRVTYVESSSGSESTSLVLPAPREAPVSRQLRQESRGKEKRRSGASSKEKTRSYHYEDEEATEGNHQNEERNGHEDTNLDKDNGAEWEEDDEFKPDSDDKEDSDDEVNSDGKEDVQISPLLAYTRARAKRSTTKQLQSKHLKRRYAAADEQPGSLNSVRTQSNWLRTQGLREKPKVLRAGQPNAYSPGFTLAGEPFQRRPAITHIAPYPTHGGVPTPFSVSARAPASTPLAAIDAVVQPAAWSESSAQMAALLHLGSTQASMPAQPQPQPHAATTTTTTTTYVLPPLDELSSAFARFEEARAWNDARDVQGAVMGTGPGAVALGGFGFGGVEAGDMDLDMEWQHAAMGHEGPL
ncbi:hypothetical protein MBLNU459_g2187t2 [Dothideomycetes sp. NU459]